MTRPTAPPADPRTRNWTPPLIGTYYLRTDDQSVWQVRNVYRRDRQVQLTPAAGGKAVYVYAEQLAREYREAVA